MPNEIYHRSEWGNPKAEGFGDVYFDAAATNKLYNHSDYYENSDGTDKILRDIPNKASIVLTPTAYSDGSLNTVIPTDGNGDFDFSRGSSATRVNEQGLIESIASGLPRIDYTSGFGSLLLEPQRTNLVTYSEDFSQSVWNELRATITANSTTSPDGSNTATLLKEDTTASNTHIIYYGGSLASSTYSMSVFAKAKERTKIGLGTGNITQSAIFDLSNGTIINTGAHTASIQNYGNGWYRCNITTTTTTPIRIVLIDDNNNTSYTGDGISGIYIWGATFEAGSYATSYIVSNSGSTTTRSADVANNSGNADLFNDSEGVLYAEIAALTDADGDASLRFISLSNGTSSKRITIYYFSSETFGVQLKNDGYELTDLYIGGSVDRTQFNKIALYYSGSNVKAYLNGIEVFTNSSWIPFSANTINTLTFTGGALSDLPFYGKVKELAVFKEALTDAELQQLTS